MKRRLQIEFNSPVIIWYTLLSFVVLIFHYITGAHSTGLLFTCYNSGLLNPMTYLRMFTYVFGHADINHYVSNFTMIALIGPMLEEKYGSKRLILMMTVTAFIGGMVHILLMLPTHNGSGLVGASGIVFLFIILCSCTSVASGKIPLTMVLVVIIYIGQEILTGITATDNVSQITHILGGLCGIFFGLYYNSHPVRKRT